MDIKKLLIGFLKDSIGVVWYFMYSLCGANVVQLEKRKIRKSLIFNFLRIIFRDPLGARTQDPNIKSVVLYRLS